MSDLGVAKKLGDELLPTLKDIYNHYIYLNEVNLESGEWHKTTPFETRARKVSEDVATLWNRTGIPHNLDTRYGQSKVADALLKCKNVRKTGQDRRESYGDQLFDAAYCRHTSWPECDCPETNKVNKY